MWFFQPLEHLALERYISERRPNYFSKFLVRHLRWYSIANLISQNEKMSDWKHSKDWSNYIYVYCRDTFFTLILKYLLPAPWIDYLEHLEHFYGIRSKSFIVKDLEISLQRFHITNITYKTRCEMLHNINSLDSSDGRVIGFHPQG